MGYHVVFQVNNINVAKNELEGKVEEALMKCGEVVQTRTKINTPVDTGNLKNSFQVKMASKNTVAIGTDVEYGKYVELGTGIYAEGGGGRQTPWTYQDRSGEWHTTRGMKAHHMLRDGVTESIGECKTIIIHTLK